MTVFINYSIDAIAQICDASFLIRNSREPQPVYLSLDSRRIHSPAKTLFIAIRTHFQDATKFIVPLYNKGCRNFLTDDEHFNASSCPGSNILLVKNSVAALQSLAAFHRARYADLPVIGITGSNGKTIVKEWLNYLLSHQLNIVRSPKSFNSQSGVPLSILQCNNIHNLGIIEAGISQAGEMEKLRPMILPTTGIFTNIGQAHEEGFSGIGEKIQEKLKLFSGTKTLIFPGDDEVLNREISKFKQAHTQINAVSFGYQPKNDLRILAVNKSVRFSEIEAEYQHKTIKITIPFTDEASIHNACICLLTLLVLDAPAECFALFNSLFPIAMRLEMKPGINGCTLINDSYSNDLQSLSMALGFMQQQKKGLKRTVILSDIPQSLTPSKRLYLQVADLLKQHKVEKFVGIGENLERNKETFEGLEPAFYSSVSAFLSSILLHRFRDEIILIKGARAFEFERISKVLEQKTHQTVLSVNLTRLVHNLKAYKRRLKPQTRVMAMVKAFGYGSGSHEIASVLEFNKVDYLAVAYADEGVDLRQSGITLPIMVMNTDESVWDTITANKLEPEIFSLKTLRSFLSFAERNDLLSYPIHIKLDTGMHRLGFMADELPEVAGLLNNNKSLKVVSAFTHLAASDDAEKDAFTAAQFELFRSCVLALEQLLGYAFLKHVSNTAASGRLPQMQMDMVRLGIGLYGIDANPVMQSELLPVASLATTISQIKKIPAGDQVGYGCNAILTKPSVIATVRIGYADGYSRSLGNGAGTMLVKGVAAPVAGNVCMDMTMLDITGIENVSEGDEVIVFGKDLPLQQVAASAATIPYEIMTGISQRVKRVYFEE